MSFHHLIGTGGLRMRLMFIFLLGLIAIGAAFPVFAGPAATGDIEWGVMGVKLFGGIALFLFGMEQMSEGLKAAAGETLKDVLLRVISYYIPTCEISNVNWCKLSCGV